MMIILPAISAQFMGLLLMCATG